MFASHNNQRDHDNQSSSQTVNESLAIPPHMGFQDLSQEHDTFEPDDNVFEPDDNVIELGLGLGMMDVQNGLDTHELQEVGESEGEEEEDTDNQTFDTTDVDAQRGIFEYHSDWGSDDENDGYDSYS